MENSININISYSYIELEKKYLFFIRIQNFLYKSNNFYNLMIDK